MQQLNTSEISLLLHALRKHHWIVCKIECIGVYKLVPKPKTDHHVLKLSFAWQKICLLKENRNDMV